MKVLGKLTAWIRSLYDWVLGWADHRYGAWALFGIAFAESSFFPIPPDLLLIPLAIAIPFKAFRYAAICTAGSVLGGVFGYMIGYQFFDVIGEPIVRFYSAEGQYSQLQGWYERWDALLVLIASLTFIPFKVATITAGFFHIDITRFIVAAAVGRAIRFFAVGALIRAYGAQIRRFIEKYFDILSVLFLVLLVGGFVVLRWLTR